LHMTLFQILAVPIMLNSTIFVLVVCFLLNQETSDTTLGKLVSSLTLFYRHRQLGRGLAG